MNTNTEISVHKEQYEKLKEISEQLKKIQEELDATNEAYSLHTARLQSIQTKQQANENDIQKLKKRFLFRKKANTQIDALQRENESFSQELQEIQSLLDEKNLFLAEKKAEKAEFERIRADIFELLRPYWENFLSLDKHEDSFVLNADDWSKTYEEFKNLVLIFKPDTAIRRSLNDMYYTGKKREKTVVVLGLGRNVRGNMTAVLDILNHDDAFADFHIYVRTIQTTDALVNQFILQNGWLRTETVLDTGKYDALLESAEFLIAESFLPEGWIKQPFQKYINTWHGTPLKKLGLAKQFRTAHKNGTVQKNFIVADYLLYPNDYTRKNILESYKVSQLLQGQTFLLGYPRTGTMLAVAADNLQNIKEKLAPNGENFYAYMPTFRDYLKEEDSAAQIKNFLDYMDKNLSENQILYVNLHHKVNDSLDYSEYNRVKQFPSDIDSYLLLAASEALITDYSSVFFDYLALRKQIVLYIADYDTYRKKRGMYMDIMDLPFDKATTPADVLAALNAGKQYDDSEVFQTFCGHDSSENARKLCSLFLDTKPEVALSAPEKTAEHCALVYSDAFPAGRKTEFLHEFTKTYDRSKEEVYLSCWVEKTDENRNVAYPMLFETPVIGGDMNLHFTGVGAEVRKLMLEETIPFEAAMVYLKYDYALISRRQYGNAKFDIVVIYDAEEVDSFLFLAEMDAPKILFLQESVLGRIEKGDRILANAVRYAAKYSRAVCVLEENLKQCGEELLGAYWKDKIQVIKTPEAMCEIVFGTSSQE